MCYNTGMRPSIEGLFRDSKPTVDSPVSQIGQPVPPVVLVRSGDNGAPKPRTQTRKHINALLQQDWEDINVRLDKAIQEIREIQEARNDIELIAKLSNIELV